MAVEEGKDVGDTELHMNQTVSVYPTHRSKYLPACITVSEGSALLGMIS